jgi:hypothetical protein
MANKEGIHPFIIDWLERRAAANGSSNEVKDDAEIFAPLCVAREELRSPRLGGNARAALARLEPFSGKPYARADMLLHYLPDALLHPDIEFPEAVEWVNQFSASRPVTAQKTFRTLFESVAPQRSAAAAEWLMSNAAHPNYESALAGFIKNKRALQQIDPEVFNTFLGTIAAKELQVEVSEARTRNSSGAP